jgi:phenylacetate-CoA ligase
MAAVRRWVNASLLGLDRATSRELSFFRQHEWDTPSQVAETQRARLAALLSHAMNRVPYYRELFQRAGLCDNSSAEAMLSRFETLPLLDKATVRSNFAALQSDDIRQRDCIENWSGGTTGEPLAFMQERDEVRVTGGAVLRWFHGWHGVNPGDREVKLWGSGRDLFYGRPPLSIRLRDAVKGVKLVNTFSMPPEGMKDLIGTMNAHRPVLVKGYSSSLFEIALYCSAHNLKIDAPRVVISTAGVLYPVMREKIESSFGCPVYDHYGAREVHGVAMECPERAGMHVSSFTHLVEVVDEQGRNCPPGTEGELVITSLLNYAMPLIRYRIGDRGTLAASGCRCGRGLPMLSGIGGRTVEAFRTRNGGVVLGEFFIYLFEVILKGGAFAKVQVVQEDYDLIKIRAVLLPGRQLTEEVKDDVRRRVRAAMGENCRVEFVIRDSIAASASGKYRYTVCEIPGLGGPSRN